MEIRSANSSDVASIQQIVVNAYHRYVERIGKPPGPMLDDYSAHIRNHTIWVAETDGIVMGLVVLLPQKDHLLLDNVAVDPACHGRGIGRALLAFADQEAIRLGYDALHLYTHEKMTENILMYPALGWKEVGRGEQNGYKRVFFRKHIGNGTKDRRF